jgi:pyruvate carboxylase
MWGGATFDTAMRFLHEDPWLRLARAARAHPEHLFPDALPRLATRSATRIIPPMSSRVSSSTRPRRGIDIFRIFDSLNYTPNMKAAMEAVQETHAICEAAICYTGDILDPKRAKYSLKYYVKLAKELERMGAHFLAIKDMAGLCRPYAAQRAGEGAQGGNRHPDPFPHARHQRRERRLGPAASDAGWMSSISRSPR